MDQQEVNTLTECFQVPEKDRKLRYMNSLGDGDLKSFLEIPNLGIYAQILVKKLECVGYIQKTIG